MRIEHRAFGVLATLSVTMCAVEHVGTVQEDITTPDNEWFVNDFLMTNPGSSSGYPSPPSPAMITYPQASETSITRVVMPNFSVHLVMGFNDHDLDRPRTNPITPAGTTHDFNEMGWAFTDLSQPFAWEYCNAWAPHGTRGTMCGLSETPLTPEGNVVPYAPPSDHFLGDPILLATGNPDGWVGYVARGHEAADIMNPGLSRYVIISHSIDGGKSFRSTNLVNPAGPCSMGETDMPHASVDTSVSPPKLLVAWRHADSIGGTQNTICFTAADIDVVNGSIFNIITDQLTDLDVHGEVGGLMILPATPLPWPPGNHDAVVIYTNTIDGQPNTLGLPCPGVQMGWRSVFFTYQPGTLSGAPRPIQDSTTFSWCPASAMIGNTFRSFGAVRMSDGTFYVVTNPSQGKLSVFTSTDNAQTWQPMIDFDGASLGHASMFFPALASDGPQRLGLVYYATDGTDTRVRTWFLGALAASANAWDPETALTPSRPIPQTLGQPPFVRRGGSLGDYIGIAAGVYNPDRPTSYTYFPAWTSWDPVNGNPFDNQVPFERVEYNRVSLHF